MAMVACAGNDLEEIGCSIPARFAAIDTGIPPQKLVLVGHVMFVVLIILGNIVLPGATDGMNKRYIQAIFCQQGEVMCAGKLPRCKQAMGILVVSIMQSQLRGFLIHLIDEVLLVG